MRWDSNLGLHFRIQAIIYWAITALCTIKLHYNNRLKNINIPILLCLYHIALHFFFVIAGRYTSAKICGYKVEPPVQPRENIAISFEDITIDIVDFTPSPVHHIQSPIANIPQEIEQTSVIGKFCSA